MKHARNGPRYATRRKQKYARRWEAYLQRLARTQNQREELEVTFWFLVDAMHRRSPAPEEASRIVATAIESVRDAAKALYELKIKQPATNGARR